MRMRLQIKCDNVTSLSFASQIQSESKCSEFMFRHLNGLNSIPSNIVFNKRIIMNVRVAA